MNAILHGTWITDPQGDADELFFVWAERAARAPRSKGQGSRVQRHPYAATTIEIADLLAAYVPDVAWRAAERLTRVAVLPSTEGAPLAPRWLLDAAPEEDGDVALAPWRVEGIGVPVLDMLYVLAALPLGEHSLPSPHRLGADIRFWGQAAKFALELLARQRFLPGLRAANGSLRAVWLPVLDAAHDVERLTALVRGMPPACRALYRERDVSAGRAQGRLHTVRAQVVLQSFIEHLVNSAVREWSGEAAPERRHDGRGPDVSSAWWRALWAEDDHIDVSPTRQRELTRFYQAWQSWTYQAQPAADSIFRLCFRLEPPEYDGDAGHVVSPSWTLRYLLQARDDLSLLVPVSEVWRERGNVLSYLNYRFDRPQEKLLEGLGRAARLCPPIQRSLKAQSPESATLSAQEAYTFLRETARLLEDLGFGVMVPPWWSKPDARLSIRARLRAAPDTINSGILSMSSLVAYDWELALGDETLTREEFERLAELKTPLVQVRGRWVLLQADQVEAAIAFWERQRDRGELPLREALALALGARSDIEGLPVGDILLDDWLSDLLDTLAGDERLELVSTPCAFVGELRPYQSRGLSWLAFLWRWGLGACLADDMGLGKTIQAIALLLHQRETLPNVGPSLLICPTSLVGNWQREVERFAPRLRVMVHHGTGRAEGEDFVARSLGSDLVISTYGLARRDVDDLSKLRWSGIILDEAQNIKNPLTKQARAIRHLEGDHRLALTGTPVENRLSELWSIMSFLNSGYLGSLERFRRTFAVPIERFQDDEASARLRRLVRPFILRRLKTDPKVIQDLPEKVEYKVYCNLTREQATLYEAVVRSAMEELRGEDASQAHGSVGSGPAFDRSGSEAKGQRTLSGPRSLRRRGVILAMLTRLKQVCDHPALFLADGSETSTRSGKMNRLTEMLEEVLAVGDRALVFTQFAQMGHLLQRHLQEVFGQEVLFLHGGVPQRQRDRLLLRFQDDERAPAIFVLSLKAGGTGLNLMRANHVFHYDRWWNPAVENQATDRAYRIGQSRDVQVHKFISVGTLEERIDTLIESKRVLAENVVGTGEAWLTELDTDELRDLIMLRTDAVEAD
jgi:SNF2 family DNA or RNA helicase